MPEARINETPKTETPPSLGREWQERTAGRARRIGYIHLGNLAIIFALDDRYLSDLRRLYVDFKGSKSLGDSPDFSTFGSRLDFWNHFLAALAPSNSELPWYKDHGGTPIPFTPLYLFNKQTKEYEKMIGMHRVSAGSDAYVKLEDLKPFLEGLQLPLPSLLFLANKGSQGKKLRPSQMAKNEAVRIGRSIWTEENNAITK